MFVSAAKVGLSFSGLLSTDQQEDAVPVMTDSLMWLSVVNGKLGYIKMSHTKTVVLLLTVESEFSSSRDMLHWKKLLFWNSLQVGQR